MRRVVVTGLGAITSLGEDVPTIWENLVNGKSGVSRIERFDTSDLRSKIAAEIKNFDPQKKFKEEKVGGIPLAKADRFLLYTLWAADEAIKDSGFLDQANPERVGVIIGTGIGGVETLEKATIIGYTKGYNRVSAYAVPMMIPDMGSGLVSIVYGLKGPNYSTSSACASSAHALGDALRLIRYGDADIIVTGGGEAPIVKTALGSFASMRALSTRNDEPEKASRPFDAERDGFVMAEGAAVLILEEYEHAKRRGAKIYAEVLGYGATADAYHVTAPCTDGEGAIKAMRRALEDAKLNPEDIYYINAHGTSTKLNDLVETIAIKAVFGQHAYRLPISSTKSMTGHLLGAAGALEALVTVKTIETGVVPPTINYEHPDPDCDLDYVPNQAREVEVKYALSNSFGFGGHNAVLVFGKV